MTRRRALTPELEEEVARKFELHLRYAPKRLCQEYGISRSALSLIIDRVRANSRAQTSAAGPAKIKSGKSYT